MLKVLLLALSIAWFPMSESGNAWHYMNTFNRTIGTCYQVPVKFGELWVGKYYGKSTEAMTGEFESLHDCVDWIEHHVYGGYYL